MKIKKGTGVRRSNPREELLDEELIGRAIWECLRNGDSEGAIKVIRIYLEALNQTNFNEYREGIYVSIMHSSARFSKSDSRRK